MTYVGRPLLRREDERVLRGEARYLDDLEFTGLAHVAFARSPFAHARVRGIRKPRSGALLVLTAADLGGIRPLPVQVPEGAEATEAPHPVLADGVVAYAGQPVAAVVAETRALAEDAVALVEVDYDPLEAVVDPRASSETLLRFTRHAGDVEEAFARAYRRVKQHLCVPRIVAAPIETRGAIAVHDGEEDRLTVWISAQDPHRQRSGLAHVLARDEERIRVIVPDVGGAFGSKGVVSPETAAVAVAAMALGRPVKWAEDRAENFLASYQGRGLEADVELALDDAGHILGLRAELLADLGAYLFPTTAIPPHTTAMLMSGCYRIPAVAVEVTGVRTNKVPTGPCRGAGRPEAAYLLERTIDVAARALALDPVELRRRNLIPNNAFPYRTPLGWTYDSGDYERCLDRALELVRPERGEDGDHVVGTGVGMYVERAGGLWESAEVAVDPAGRFVVSSSSSPHGQGHETTFAQVAADELGVEPEQVAFRFGDSAVVPAGTGTFASRSTSMGGSAVLLACRRLREEAERAAGRLWAELDPADLAGLSATARFESPLVFSSGCYAAVVEIERATGRLRVLRLAAVDDAGRVVNPLLAEGQVLGGTVHGLGECLVEEAVHDGSGNPLSTSFAGYSLLTAAEVPPVAAAFVETPSPYNPLGAKGIGEGGAIGTLPAVANAVADALGGSHVDPPFLEEKLWAALREVDE